MGPYNNTIKTYRYHTRVCESDTGLISNKVCLKELSLEKSMGTKKRVDSISRRRNYLNFASLGDKEYSSPERSSNFFNQPIVFNSLYGPIKKYDRRPLKQQLGEVKGIFTSMLQNPLIKNK
jgi:hypothetical protein